MAEIPTLAQIEKDVPRFFELENYVTPLLPDHLSGRRWSYPPPLDELEEIREILARLWGAAQHFGLDVLHTQTFATMQTHFGHVRRWIEADEGPKPSLKATKIPGGSEANAALLDAISMLARRARLDAHPPSGGEGTRRKLRGKPLKPLTANEEVLFDALSTDPQTGPDIVARLLRDGYRNFNCSMISRMCKKEKPLWRRGVRHRKGAGYYLR